MDLADQIINNTTPPSPSPSPTIADQIINNSNTDDRLRWESGDYLDGEVDDRGIKYPGVDTPLYLVARILAKHQDHLYFRDNKIFDRNTNLPVPQTKESAVRLSGRDSPLLRGGKYTLVFDELIKHLPEFSENIIQITDNLFFDSASGSPFLVTTKQQALFVRYHDRKWHSDEELSSWTPPQDDAILIQEKAARNLQEKLSQLGPATQMSSMV